jgi:ABC-type glycerol-3-phosphate transport system permease component
MAETATRRKARGLREHSARFSVYLILFLAGLIVLIPFLLAFFGSFKTSEDISTYPPRLLPYAPTTATVDGQEVPLFTVTVGSFSADLAQIAGGGSAGEYRSVATNEQVVFAKEDQVQPTGKTIDVGGETKPVVLATSPGGGDPVESYLERSRIVNTFVDPANSSGPETYAPKENAVAVETVQFQTQNYSEVLALSKLDRALTNTVLITILVVVGQVVTSILGGYAFARVKFAGRDKLFLFYLGSIMIPFVVLLIPLYRLMVTIGWVNDLSSLVIPFVFTAYGTFLMRQFFVGIPREIEEAAVIDGASRWRILWQVFVPLSIPAIATLATFSFLYAWNSFIWPLIILDSGNLDNNVLSVALSTLGGRAADNANLVLAGVMIAMLPPITVFLLAQRTFVENVASTGLKG